MQGNQCPNCKHYRGVLGRDGAVCEAFRNGIPEDILLGLADHRQPYPNDNGIRFEEMPRNGSA